MISSQEKVILLKRKDVVAFKNIYRKECDRKEYLCGYSKNALEGNFSGYVLLAIISFGPSFVFSELLIENLIYGSEYKTLITTCFFAIIYSLIISIFRYDYSYFFYRVNLLREDFYIVDQMYQKVFDNKGSIGENNPEYRLKLRTMAAINKKIDKSAIIV